MLIEATDVRQVPVSEITDDRRATRRCRGPRRRCCRGWAATDPVWRVDFVFVGPDDRIARRNDTSPEDLTAVIARVVAPRSQWCVDPPDTAADRALPGHRVDHARSPRRPGSTGIQAQRAQVERARPDREPRCRISPVAAWRGRAALDGIVTPLIDGDALGIERARIKRLRWMLLSTHTASVDAAVWRTGGTPCGSSIGRTVDPHGTTTRARQEPQLVATVRRDAELPRLRNRDVGQRGVPVAFRADVLPRPPR